VLIFSEQYNERRKRIGIEVKDVFADEYQRIIKLLQGIKQPNLPHIKRIKGLFRKEGKLSEGIFSLYLSPYAEWIDDFEIETSIELVTKLDHEFEKPTYTEFSVEEVGFYIYGNNLDRKELIRWFNKNLLTVSVFLKNKQIDLQRPRTRANITLEEIKNLELKNCYTDLGGAVFDGHFFRNMQGEVLSGHPSIIDI